MTDPRFTPAERDVLDCVRNGWGYSMMAEWLGIKPTTARRLVHRIAHKLPLRPGGLSGYERVLYWISFGS